MSRYLGRLVLFTKHKPCWWYLSFPDPQCVDFLPSLGQKWLTWRKVNIPYTKHFGIIFFSRSWGWWKHCNLFPETNITTENDGWKEYVRFGKAYFQGRAVIFKEGIGTFFFGYSFQVIDHVASGHVPQESLSEQATLVVGFIQATGILTTPFGNEPTILDYKIDLGYPLC